MIGDRILHVHLAWKRHYSFVNRGSKLAPKTPWQSSAIFKSTNGGRELVTLLIVGLFEKAYACVGGISSGIFELPCSSLIASWSSNLDFTY